MAKAPRVRIGPSPTGEPHVGTAYIALFNLAFARQNGGSFILRIEDTDQERSKPEWEAQIMEGLRWLGLNWDEGPDIGGPAGTYRQSERADIYRAHAEQLLAKGDAYCCFATPEELKALRDAQRAAGETPRYDRRHRDLPLEQRDAWIAEGRPYVVRMKAPLEGQIVVKDQLRGEIVFDAEQVDDQVILKSDGMPTYHLANVVDDHLMQISHVIRAEEWLSSTPKHLVLYKMFGWEPPVFIHMPLLRNPDQSKISKRKNPVSLIDYQSRGFLPEALLNYLSQMGWTMEDGREIYDLDTFIQNFSWDRMSLGGPIFDLEKLTWMNGKYMREIISKERWVSDLSERFSKERLSALFPLFQQRIDVYEDFVGAADFFFSGSVAPDPALLVPKKMTAPDARKMLLAYVEAVETEIDFSAAHLEAFSRSFAEAEAYKTRDLFMALRVAVTGRKASPGLFEVMAELGRAQVRRRLREAAEILKRVK